MSRRLHARFALLVTLACAPKGGPPPADAPFITGSVTAIGRVAEGWTVHVEEDPRSSASPKVVLRVGEATEVRRAAGGRARADDLREGQRVRVWITGPVMKSYPPQAVPRVIVIDTEAP